MVSLIRQNHFINKFLLLPYAFLVRIHSFIHPKIYQVKEEDTTLTKLIFSFLGDNAIMLSTLSTLLCWVIAIVLTTMTNSSKLFHKQNILIGVFFILLSSFLTTFQTLTPALLGCLFFSLFLYECLRITKNSIHDLRVFNIGAYTSLATYVCVPFNILFICAIIALQYFRSLNLKDILKYLTGVASIILIFNTLLYIFDFAITGWNCFFIGLDSLLLNWAFWSIPNLVFMTICLSTVIVSFLNIYNLQKKKLSETRKKIQYFFNISIILYLPLLIYSCSDINTLLIIIPVSALFIALLLDFLNSIIAIEIIHLLILLMVLNFQFGWLNYNFL